MGLYAGVVGAIVGALWGSSSYGHTGPTSALSLLVLSGLSATIIPGTKEFVLAAGLLAVMAGVFQIVMGLARLGMLVNFVSDAVIVGFAAGAGVQIAVGELRHLFGLDYTSRSIVGHLENLVINLPHTHLLTLGLGVGTIALILVLKEVPPATARHHHRPRIGGAAALLFPSARGGGAGAGRVCRTRCRPSRRSPSSTCN